jgi:beta-glucosidase
VAGDEVVLGFMHPPSSAPSSGGLPLLRQLFGFERVSLAPGASTTVYFALSDATLHLASAEGDTVAYPGDYKISFTNGVDLTLGAAVTLTGAAPRVVEQFAGRAA